MTTNLFEFHAIEDARKTGEPFAYVIDHALDLDYMFHVSAEATINEVAATVAKATATRPCRTGRLSIFLCRGEKIERQEERYLVPVGCEFVNTKEKRK